MSSADPRRILVAGVSGSGKSTLCAQIEQAVGLPHTEMDALFHGPGWQPRPEFLADVRHLVAGDSWVTEWQYPQARALLAEHADLLMWLDPPTAITLFRVTRRTVSRRLRRTELWNGNREVSLWTFFTDREHILRWAFSTRGFYREAVPALAVEYPGLTIVRLRRPSQIRQWIAELGQRVR